MFSIWGDVGGGGAPLGARQEGQEAEEEEPAARLQLSLLHPSRGHQQQEGLQHPGQVTDQSCLHLQSAPILPHVSSCILKLLHWPKNCQALGILCPNRNAMLSRHQIGATWSKVLVISVSSLVHPKSSRCPPCPLLVIPISSWCPPCLPYA